MGNDIISFYKSRIKKTWKTAFLIAFVGCLLIHLYKFTNTLPNHDSLYNVYRNQDMTISGRWFLQYACGISSYFDLPWFNGLLSAVYLGITAAAVTELFDMKNPIVIGLSSLVLVACPSTTETFFFEFTADGYLLGLMLSTLAACLSCKDKRLRGGDIISAICLCLSLAIYQAYISFAIVLSICYLADQLIDGKITTKDVRKWIGKQVVIYAAAMIAYYLIWQLILTVSGQSATSYQGINAVGKIGLETLVHGAVSSIKNLFFFYLEWNILEHPITLYAVLNIVFVVCLLGVAVVAIIKSRTYKDRWKLLTVLFCLAACVPVISVWCFLSDGVSYRPMMMHSAVVLYIFAIVLFDKWISPKLSTVYGIFMAVMIFNFAVMANISYFYLNQCYERSYYIGSQMMEDIAAEQKKCDISSIAIVGERVKEVGIADSFPACRIHILSNLLESDCYIDQAHTWLFLTHVLGMDIPQATGQMLIELESMNEVKEMNTWPEEGSVQIIDNILVIKLGEIS